MKEGRKGGRDEGRKKRRKKKDERKDITRASEKKGKGKEGKETGSGKKP